MAERYKYVDIAVVMLSYNHEAWISRAIESVLMQRTSASFKIYIHDDASTDRSQDVIRTYRDRFPEKTECIFQQENQYSKGRGIGQFILPKLNCKYVAMCECDDYWTDRDKLQIQYEYMEAHKKCMYTFGNAVFVSLNGAIQKKFMWHQWKHDQIGKKLRYKNGACFTPEELILTEFTPTATTMFRSLLWQHIADYQDQFDLTTRLAAAEHGYGYYFNRIMAAYRSGNACSANGQASASFTSYKKLYFERHLHTLREFDRRTQGRFRDTVRISVERKRLHVYQRFLMIRKMRQCPAYQDLVFEYKMRCYLKKYCRWLYEVMKNLGAVYTRIRYGEDK